MTFPAPAFRAAVLALALAVAAAPRAAGAAPWDAAADFVAVSRDSLVAGQKPVRFVCADLSGEPPSDEAGAEAAAEDLWFAGFDLVRLPFLPPDDSSAGPGSGSAADAFVAACRSLGVRIWGEVLGPASAAPASPADVALVDDPGTADAWTNAVSEALASPGGASRLSLAAAWDPRLEVALQRRVRAWGRAFNPRTGLRRCEDPAFALFSFSSRWLDEMSAPDRPPLPDFFEDSLREWWGNWLYDRFRSDERTVEALGPMLPGETVASNTVAFPPLDPADTNRTSAFRSEQRLFLHNLDIEHLKRVVEPFSVLGPAARVAPRLVSHGDGRAISALSTVALVRRGDGERGGQPLRDDVPLVWQCVPGADLRAEAARAAAAGADVFVVPVSAGLFEAEGADAAAVFRCGNVGRKPDGVAGTELADYVRASGRCGPPSGTNAVSAAASFPVFGAEVRFVGGSGSDVRRAMDEMASATNAAPLLLVVHLPDPPQEVGEPGSASQAAAESFEWKLLVRRDGASGPLALRLDLAGPDGGPAPFGIVAGGQALAKRSMSESGVSGSAPELPEAGTFSREVPSGSARLVFRPELVAPVRLRAP